MSSNPIRGVSQSRREFLKRSAVAAAAAAPAWSFARAAPVSYTHLTLPTILRV